MKKTVLLCSLVAIVAFVAGFKVGEPNHLQGVIYAKDSVKINDSWELIRVGTTRVVEDRLIDLFG